MAGRGRPMKSDSKKHYTKKEQEDRKKVKDAAKEKKNVKLKAPSYLDATEKKAFDSIAKTLAKKELITEENTNTLAMYIKAIDRYLEIDNELKENGYAVHIYDKNGKDIVATNPSPFLKTLDMIENKILRLEKELCINLSDRIRLQSMILIKEDVETEKDKIMREIREEALKQKEVIIDENAINDALSKIEGVL